MTAKSSMEALTAREALTLLVTDSGLGGLAVVADLERRARASGRYRELDLVFASALGETGQGYNKMKRRERKLAVFDDALAGMLAAFPADALLVACNTLSVLIPESRVLASTPMPVVGIVEAGVEPAAEAATLDSEAVVLLFATETTIEAGTHRRALVERGIPAARVVPLPCPGLASSIELEGRSPGVVAAIRRFAGEGLAIAGQPASVVAVLGCSHYGYAADDFAAGLASSGAPRAVVVDPNRRLADRFFPPDGRPPFPAPRVTVRVVSRALPLPGEIASTAALLDPVSPATAAALRSYELRRELFPFAGLDG